MQPINSVLSAFLTLLVLNKLLTLSLRLRDVTLTTPCHHLGSNNIGSTPSSGLNLPQVLGVVLISQPSQVGPLAPYRQILLESKNRIRIYRKNIEIAVNSLFAVFEMHPVTLKIASLTYCASQNGPITECRTFGPRGQKYITKNHYI